MRLTYPFEFYLHFSNVILAGVTIVFALYLIPLTGKARAWLLFSAALVFLLLERLFELLNYVGIFLDQPTIEVARDIMSLFMTGCLFGSVYFIRGIFLERKLAAETLRKANIELSLFRKLLDNSSDAIEVIDPITSRFLDVNEKACLDLGYSREELLSMSAFDIDPSFSLDSRKELDVQI